MDKEKILQQLGKIVADNPYDSRYDLIPDTIALIKEQEAKIEQLNRYVNGFSRDAMHVVRCKDCIHYRYYGLSEETVSECRIDHCENPDGNWFCADGERK